MPKNKTVARRVVAAPYSAQDAPLVGDRLAVYKTARAESCTCPNHATHVGDIVSTSLQNVMHQWPHLLTDEYTSVPAAASLALLFLELSLRYRVHIISDTVLSGTGAFKEFLAALDSDMQVKTFEQGEHKEATTRRLCIFLVIGPFDATSGSHFDIVVPTSDTAILDNLMGLTERCLHGLADAELPACPMFIEKDSVRKKDHVSSFRVKGSQALSARNTKDRSAVSSLFGSLHAIHGETWIFQRSWLAITSQVLKYRAETERTTSNKILAQFGDRGGDSLMQDWSSDQPIMY